MGDSVKSFPKVKVNTIQCSPITHQANHVIAEGYHVG